jgi:6-phosphogluconolactonase (cycloisomerase 2 family)
MPHARTRSGRYLYVSNRGHDSLTAFAVGPDGLVTPCQWIPSGGRWPWFFALTDDSRMIVANNMSDNIVIFDIDPRGRLHASDQVAVRRPVFIAPAGRPPSAASAGSDTAVVAGTAATRPLVPIASQP